MIRCSAVIIRTGSKYIGQYRTDQLRVWPPIEKILDGEHQKDAAIRCITEELDLSDAVEINDFEFIFRGIHPFDFGITYVYEMIGPSPFGFTTAEKKHFPFSIYDKLSFSSDGIEMINMISDGFDVFREPSGIEKGSRLSRFGYSLIDAVRELFR